MPGLDGTGPQGQGPMTGGARGYCVRPARELTAEEATPDGANLPVRPGRRARRLGRGIGGHPQCRCGNRWGPPAW